MGVDVGIALIAKRSADIVDTFRCAGELECAFDDVGAVHQVPRYDFGAVMNEPDALFVPRLIVLHILQPADRALLRRLRCVGLHLRLLGFARFLVRSLLALRHDGSPSRRDNAPVRTL